MDLRLVVSVLPAVALAFACSDETDGDARVGEINDAGASANPTDLTDDVATEDASEDDRTNEEVMDGGLSDSDAGEHTPGGEDSGTSSDPIRQEDGGNPGPDDTTLVVDAPDGGSFSDEVPGGSDSDDDEVQDNNDGGIDSGTGATTGGDPLVLAAFVAWHGLPSHMLGAQAPTRPYDSSDPEVITEQIERAMGMGIDGFVVDWRGPPDAVENQEERTFVDGVLRGLLTRACEVGFKIAVLYDEGTVKAAEASPENYTSRVMSDLGYAEREYFGEAGAFQQCYLQIDGAPAVFVFSYDDVDTAIDWQVVRTSVAEEIKLIDKDPNPQDPAHDSLFDGFYAWVYATDGNWQADGSESGARYLEWFYPTMQTGAYAQTACVGGVWAGFDDRLASWGTERFMARGGTAVFDDTMALARASSCRFVLISTWNDVEEGTDIEFGLESTVDMAPSYAEVLVRSTPTRIRWDGSSDSVLQVYREGVLIFDEPQVPGVCVQLGENARYEVKVWSGGVVPLAAWVHTRSLDPIPDCVSPVVVE